jgi:3-dehydroquinate synthase
MYLNHTKTAVILAAGRGERLNIFEIPKPLVKLGEKSMVCRTVDVLLEAGVNKIYIVVNKGEILIKKELFGKGNEIEYIEVYENKNGMLGSIMAIEDRIKEPFFITACDLLFSRNPYSYFSEIEENRNKINVLVSGNKENNRYSGANMKMKIEEGQIIEYFGSEKDDLDDLAFEAGIYHFNSDSFAEFLKIKKDNPDLNIVQVFKGCVEKNLLKPVYMDDVWFDINNPVTLVRAELFLQNANTNGEINVKVSEYKKLKPEITFNYKKPLRFDVIVENGIIDSASEYEIIPHEYYYSPHHILIDKNIDALYGDKIFKQFKNLGYKINKILVDPGENSKSIEVYTKIANEMISKGIDKKSIIISVGGGVIKDLAGFLASSIYRGISMISFPTTVLSQCDAAIALKQGVNGDKGKNLFGSYYPPLKVIADPKTLLTLEDRYIYDGLAECLKQSFAQDESYFKFFNEYEGDIKNLDFLEKTVKTAVNLKVTSIEKDFNEENFALVNQYGHEVGHAVEHLSGYKLLHGESVAIGMRVSAELSCILGISNIEVLDSHISLLKKYRLPTAIPEYIKPEDIISSLRFSKKFHGNRARFVLVDKIGSIWHNNDYYFVACDDEVIIEALKRSYD